MSKASISYKNIPVVAVTLIEATDFNDLNEFAEVVERQDLPIAALTSEAWYKYERLVEPSPTAKYEENK